LQQRGDLTSFFSPEILEGRMGSGFRLPNGAVADYHWGSLIPRFSSRAPVDTRTLVNILSAATHGLGSWSTNAEFREVIAFEHEIVHYFQDMLTGVGHWDFLKRREYHRGLLGLARQLSYLDEGLLPYKIDAAVALKQELLNEIIFVPNAKLSENRRNEIVREFTALPHQVLNEEKRIEELLFVENIFEAEAVATVALRILNLSMNEVQGEIALQQKDLFVPSYMDEQYNLTLSLIFRSMDNVFGGDWNEEQKRGYLIIQYKVACFFIDLACAHPSPQLAARGLLSKYDYEPGIKMARLLNVFLHLSDKNRKQFFASLLRDEDFIGAEKIILQDSDYGYQASEQIYADWVDLFSKILTVDDNYIIKLRKRACQMRISSFNVGKKSLDSVIKYQLPMFFYNQSGINSYRTSMEDLDPTEGTILFADLMKNHRDIALIDFFFETGRFICPLAEGRICKVSIPACSSGITSLDQYPLSPDCTVRHSLQMNGWFM
jgi:hypothetical protein